MKLSTKSQVHLLIVALGPGIELSVNVIGSFTLKGSGNCKIGQGHHLRIVTWCLIVSSGATSGVVILAITTV
ncbi:MAG: hypothetical protein IPQ06_15395 [Chitinophagaceae bacterium]|nr:hypothetical protein [Chitinophagaceae bacterium]